MKAIENKMKICTKIYEINRNLENYYSFDEKSDSKV